VGNNITKRGNICVIIEHEGIIKNNRGVNETPLYNACTRETTRGKNLDRVWANTHARTCDRRENEEQGRLEL
jgi:hypothetical protein